MVDPSRQAALAALKAVRAGATVSEALKRVQPLSPVDRALATQLVYGVLRHQRYLDAWIHRFRPGRLDDDLRLILRLAFFQLGYLDRVPAYAAVNAAVEQAKQVNWGASQLVNAVLRRGHGDPPPPDSLPLGERYSYPDWLVERWVQRYGARTEQILERNNQVPALMLRVNLARTSREEIVGQLTALGIRAEPSPYLPESVRAVGAVWLDDLAVFRQGLMTVQDESGMLVGWVLSPQAGEDVVDLAVGVGGKAIHALEKAPGPCRLVGLDISAPRLALLSENLARTGYAGQVEPVLMPAERYALDHAGEFDRAILDAPCSGLGVLRRRVDARWQKSPRDFPALQARQVTLLQSALQLVKAGGVVVYSTCSVEPEETVQVVEKALANGRARLEDVSRYLPHPELARRVSAGQLMIEPGDLGMDGFYIARIRKEE